MTPQNSCLQCMRIRPNRTEQQAYTKYKQSAVPFQTQTMHQYCTVHLFTKLPFEEMKTEREESGRIRSIIPLKQRSRISRLSPHMPIRIPIFGCSSPWCGNSIPINEKLCKNPHVQKQGPQAPRQPRSINQNIPPIDGPRFTICTASSPASAVWLVGENAEDVSEVSDAGEEEEEHGDAFGALASIVEKELRYA